MDCAILELERAIQALECGRPRAEAGVPEARTRETWSWSVRSRSWRAHETWSGRVGAQGLETGQRSIKVYKRTLWHF